MRAGAEPGRRAKSEVRRFLNEGAGRPANGEPKRLRKEDNSGWDSVRQGAHVDSIVAMYGLKSRGRTGSVGGVGKLRSLFQLEKQQVSAASRRGELAGQRVDRVSRADTKARTPHRNEFFRRMESPCPSPGRVLPLAATAGRLSIRFGAKEAPRLAQDDRLGFVNSAT